MALERRYMVFRDPDPFARRGMLRSFRVPLPANPDSDRDLLRFGSLINALPEGLPQKEFVFGCIRNDKWAAVAYDGEKYVVVCEQARGRVSTKIRIPNPPAALPGDLATQILEGHLSVRDLVAALDAKSEEEEEQRLRAQRAARRSNRRKLRRRLARHLKRLEAQDG